MDWSEIVDNPYLEDLPFKIEQDRYGNILMSPPRIGTIVGKPASSRLSKER